MRVTATELESIADELRRGAEHAESTPGIEAWNTPFIGFRFTSRAARCIADVLESAAKVSRAVDGRA